MNNTIKLAVASALLAAASSASAAGGIVAGDWTLDIGGVVNAYYIAADNKDANVITGGLANVRDARGSDAHSINTGLLPNFLTVSGKTRQNDLDVGFTISMSPASSGNGATGSGTAEENRQSFLTFGDKSWGTVKVGKDLGIFGSDAILSDMTLLGVGSQGAVGSLGGTTTTLGRIGTGYQYAAWKGQISYASPNFNGFSFNVGVMHPGQNTPAVGQDSPVFEGKASYEWAGDVAGKVWAGFIQQSVTALAAAGDYDARNFEVGAKVDVAGFGLVGYYYTGQGAGTTFFLSDGATATGQERDSDGGYVQATYTLPGVGTKLGASWGISKLDLASGEALSTLVKENEMWTIGAYHPLTKHLNLVAEYSQVTSQSHLNLENESNIASVGAILFF